MYILTCAVSSAAVERYHVSVRIGEQSHLLQPPSCFVILHHARDEGSLDSSELALCRGKWEVGTADEYIVGTSRRMGAITSLTIGFNSFEEKERVFMEEVTLL